MSAHSQILAAVALTACAVTSTNAAPLPEWRGLHVSVQSNEAAESCIQLVEQVLVPRGINVLVAEVNYGLKFESHPEVAGPLDKEAARRLSQVCKDNGIRIIPLFNCLGHQSWAETTFALLREHPEFDETPEIPLNNPDIYCRSWCPLHPEVNPFIFDLIDEMLDAFEADALHIGMDEVFLIGHEQCDRCRGKDPAELFAKATNDMYAHIVGERGAEMLMWGDRLLDDVGMGYGSWEASQNSTGPAVDLVSTDIIICDWHYEPRDDYPSVRFLLEKGFRVLYSPWRNVEAALAFQACATTEDDSRMLGPLFTGWSAGSGGQLILNALTKPDAEECGEAKVLEACLAALDADGQ